MKRICSSLLIVLFILSSFTFALASEVPGGDGSAENPIIITDAAGLAAIKENLSACYVINADIDLTGTDWEPIGDADEPFTGTIDGKGHIINGLNVSESAGGDYYAGLFGVTKGATIKSIRMKATRISVTGASASEWAGLSAGALVGKAINTVIENCYNTGNISVTAEVSMVTAGGLVGEMNGNSSVKKSFNTGKVTTSSAGNLSLAGGICGAVDGGSIENCYNAGSISSSAFNATYAYAGGIAGEISSAENPSSIKTSYNAGDVTSLRESGNPDVDNAYFGSFGIVASSLHSGIENCYSINTADRCVGYVTAGDTLESTTHEISEDTNALLTPEEMMDLANFIDFSSEIWTTGADTEYSYPTLAGIPHDSVKIQDIQITPPESIKCNADIGLDITGGQLEVLYDDGETETVDFANDDVVIESFDAQFLEEQSIGGVYKNYAFTFFDTIEHELDYENVEVVEATCKNGGYIEHTCVICNEKFREDTVILEHVTFIKASVTDLCYVEYCENCDYTRKIDGDEGIDLIERLIDEYYSKEISFKDKSSVYDIEKICVVNGYTDKEIPNYPLLHEMVNRYSLYGLGDVDFDGIIKAKDLSKMLFYYGREGSYASDITEDGVVNNGDLSHLLGNYGIRLQQLMNRN